MISLNNYASQLAPSWKASDYGSVGSGFIPEQCDHTDPEANSAASKMSVMTFLSKCKIN